MKIPLLENCSENCQTSSDFMLSIYLQAWLWCLTKSPRIYDSDDGCNYTDSVDDIPSKHVHYSPIQSAAHRADCYPGYQWWAILSREPRESDCGTAESQWCGYTTGASWWNGYCCVGHIPRKNSELAPICELSLMIHMSAPADLLPGELVLLMKEKSPPLLYK